MTRQEVVDASEVIIGKILVYDLEAYVLLDPGSTHSSYHRTWHLNFIVNMNHYVLT